MKYLLAISFLVLFSCKQKKEDNHFLKSGMWKGIFLVQDDKELPFLFEVVDQQQIRVFNAKEDIAIDDIEIKGDSIFVRFPVYEGYFAAKFEDSLHFSGSFIKESLDRKLVFKASYGVTDRFDITDRPQTDVSGNWEAVFSPDNKEDEYIAKGIFKQNGNIVTGTFRTTTGDYRYLEGVVNGNTMELSTFDGAHAFLFKANINDSTMTGYFYSGNHWKEPFVAKRNESYELPSEDSLTYLKEGYDRFAFKFPDASEKQVSLDDPRFKNKVCVVQIMGTWCPNCMDETKYYVDFYERYKNKGVEFVALAFEYAKTPEKSFEAIERLKRKYSIEYPILLAQYGTSNKKKAQEKLPMLNHILSYPTSIFIDKKGKVRKIHTGFNGPATGQKYVDFTKEFESFINELLQEQV